MYGFQFAELYSIDLCKQGNLCDPSTQFGYPSLIPMADFLLGVTKKIEIYFTKTARICWWSIKLTYLLSTI